MVYWSCGTCFNFEDKKNNVVQHANNTTCFPKGYPGPPTALKAVSVFKDCITLAWCPPSDTGGTKIVGYNLEKNKKGTNYWSLVNQAEPIKGMSLISQAAMNLPFNVNL